jgi:uncharacterized membrane protein
MALSEATHEGGTAREGTPRGARRPRAKGGDGRPHPRHDDGPERLARVLGWFSVGLGIAEVAAPRGVARLIGLADTAERRLLLRALGLRELASGAGILSGRGKSGWLWSRVGGDAMDLGLLGRAMATPDAARRRVMTATAAVAGMTALDVFASERATRATAGQEIQVRRSITVARSPEDVHRFWRDFENLPRFMRHLESVEVRDERRSHWRAKAPAGTSVEWDAEIVEDEPGRRIAWRSLEGSTVPNAGTVTFAAAPGDRGTEIHVDLEYRPPAGSVGWAVAKLFGEEPGQQIADDLRRLKQILETGEVVTAKGPSARARRSTNGR